MAPDPYKYFRIEARELLENLAQGVLTLEKGQGDTELLVCLLRYAHTLKGAARVVKLPDIADNAHALEDLLVPFRDGSQQPPRHIIDAVLRLIDAMVAALALLDAVPTSPPQGARSETAPAPAPEVASKTSPAEGHGSYDVALDSVRVEIRALDALLDGMNETMMQLASLHAEEGVVERAHSLATQLTHRLSHADDVSSLTIQSMSEELCDELAHLQQMFSAGFHQLERGWRQVREGTDALRLLPVSSVFAPLERSARDAAQTLHKDINFVTSGGAHRADAHVLAALRDALLHVVRNAVDHGIESVEERVALGKPSAGRVTLEVTRKGGRLTFRCRDDGRGVDVDAVRHVAVQRGLLTASEAEQLGLDETMRYIFRHGVSSIAEVTTVSGRGVGLDVVRDITERLKGRVALQSTPGQGTVIEIEVPLTLTALSVLSIEAQAATVAIPLDAVVRTARLRGDEIAHSAECDTILAGDMPILFLPLEQLLGGVAATGNRDVWTVVIIRSSSGMAAVGVDRLSGISEVPVRSLPSIVGALPLVAGAYLDLHGSCRVVLDPAGIVEAVIHTRPERISVAPARTLPILIIDDSLTTRMMEQSILESAGYDVELAVSAEDGLEKAHRRRFGLFVVDVEMPGMDGFTFVSTARADPMLAEVPAILVTSRAAPEDRRRGAQVGARAYMVKSEFDQAHLLQITREVLGG